MDDATSTYTSQSIFGLLGEHGLKWAIYGYDSPPLTRLNFPDTTNGAESHFGLFKDFQAAASAGTLPPYSFLEPSWGSSGNSQHPNDDVALGEQLIHDVYYAVRNGKAWEQTLLIITYDEHGGCYDHVAPPDGAVPPDDSAGGFGFDFTRFGVRVPAVLISPLINPGANFPPVGDRSPRSHFHPQDCRGPLESPTAHRTDAACRRCPDPGATPDRRSLGQRDGARFDRRQRVRGRPSHMQKVQAQLVSRLPAPDAEAQRHTAMPALASEHDYDAYIRNRTALD